ncbi:MAG: hypothetical protein A3J07_04540 [Candidatus Doudnabacteria bacterium RIFCSPLOWO2_02_FULL_49_13]|uniref:Uncharacterized protein n=1 Tax=Candidatus Doudnabacteria bacterium RIFCSPHIGHO2_12_FULL_48_16 TaxID=1817838 RepID=A0A1F5PJQ0_9BACT|nr:MAG: hypothetical protein A3B77_04375 [Candidatus Doudnabacteria bacterium RIFCSPHIGHO2_02_FULL_49_24]OGE90175.1 MAG: hypothetical protein A3E29_03675 [Candidatus Doudnabacteria bacterium RIFCSPHIGHO2_12_FULL_48_16]OGF03319.1 MAG: hypothetical protein A3J07_04540 [Candidatus Doudnabacteria bacterium RIFCSPLOWO2_02_FULL_49_13]OGF03471.1 MAG: hypothetical protein A3H14_04335 [Candidatus Doudnabacteria bacterium RIFCSPLOWO2_12_FULL_49_8]
MNMTLALPVASALFPGMPPVTIEVTNATNFHQAVRVAVHHAQRKLHIAGPVVPLTEHEFAADMRRKAIAEHAPKMVCTGSIATPFWRQPEPRGAMYER